MDLIERLINKNYLTERERKEWLGTIKEHLEALEKENKKWREIVGCDLCEALGREILLEENEKLKKALSIIRNKCYSLQLTEATDEEFNLIKEVLGDE